MHTVALHVPELAENGLLESESELAVRLLTLRLTSGVELNSTQMIS
jgi:hypothetical protein